MESFNGNFRDVCLNPIGVYLWKIISILPGSYRKEAPFSFPQYFLLRKAAAAQVFV
jgi:hypothetical protein